MSTLTVNEEQRAQEFKEALKAFLAQYDHGTTKVQIEIEEDRRGIPSMELYLPTVWNEEGVELRPGTTVNLGRYFP